MSEAWGCPFCPLVVDEAEERTVMARRLFETHLDVHMARRDYVLPRVTFPRAS